MSEPPPGAVRRVLFGGKKSRRTAWRRRPAAQRSTSEPRVPQVAEVEAVEEAHTGVHDLEVLTQLREEPLKVIARLLMMPSYGEPMRAERLFLEQAGHMQRARLLQESAPASSYAARGLGEKRKQEEAFESRAHEAAAIAVRQSNEREHLFSICARSISKFMRRVPKKDWLDSQRKRE